MDSDSPGEPPDRGQAFLENLTSTDRSLSTSQFQFHNDDVLCCCGSDCAQHVSRNATLKNLEKDVRDAARVGQALLLRHETYIAESEAERSLLNDRVARLDAENKNLESRNSQLTIENSELLDQLAEFNSTVTDSEAQISSLATTLQSAQRELDKLNKLSLRTESLEAELLECEREQARLQATLTRSMEEERAAVQRWRNSQRKISELQEQMEDIEREAREERARHQEVVQRLERRSAIEKELQASTAGDTDDDNRERKNGEVVSSFVKEILRDNANMQLAMVELQDLVACYKEAELDHTLHEVDSYEALDKSHHQSLHEELGLDQKQHMPELHVHHHYHAPSTAMKLQPRSKSQRSSKLQMRRPALKSGRSTPTRMAHSPHRQMTRHISTASTSSSLGSSEGRVSKQKRLSAHSYYSQASGGIYSDPSSPPSTSYCPSTIFEQDFRDIRTDESRPTSPESNTIWSPTIRPAHRKFESMDSSFQPMSPLRLELQERMRSPHIGTISTISERSHEQGSQQLERKRSLSPSKAKFVAPPSPIRSPSPRRPMRREDSHTSLFSISGMDIHSTFPSPARTSQHGNPLLSLPWSSRQNSDVAINVTTASAIRDMQLHDNSRLDNSIRGRLGSSGVSTKKDRYAPIMDTFGKRVGGWLSSRWNASNSSLVNNPNSVTKDTESIGSEGPPVTPVKKSQHKDMVGKESYEDTPTAPVDVPTAAFDSNSTFKDLALSLSPQKASFRSTGINQAGGLPPLPLPGGFLGFGKTPITRMIDERALQECLTEEHGRDNGTVDASS